MQNGIYIESNSLIFAYRSDVLTRDAQIIEALDVRGLCYVGSVVTIFIEIFFRCTVDATFTIDLDVVTGKNALVCQRHVQFASNRSQYKCRNTCGRFVVQSSDRAHSILILYSQTIPTVVFVHLIVS
jgi:hypothetical protein